MGPPRHPPRSPRDHQGYPRTLPGTPGSAKDKLSSIIFIWAGGSREAITLRHWLRWHWGLDLRGGQEPFHNPVRTPNCSRPFVQVALTRRPGFETHPCCTPSLVGRGVAELFKLSASSSRLGSQGGLPKRYRMTRRHGAESGGQYFYRLGVFDGVVRLWRGIGSALRGARSDLPPAPKLAMPGRAGAGAGVHFLHSIAAKDVVEEERRFGGVGDLVLCFEIGSSVVLQIVARA